METGNPGSSHVILQVALQLLNTQLGLFGDYHYNSANFFYEAPCCTDCRLGAWQRLLHGSLSLPTNLKTPCQTNWTQSTAKAVACIFKEIRYKSQRMHSRSALRLTGPPAGRGRIS
jgi:hypothetical protein